MTKSPKLLSRIKRFTDKLSGVSHVDNQANPDSALNRNKKKAEMRGKKDSFDWSAYKNAKEYTSR